MSNEKTENQSTKVVTGKVRASYATVWEPKQIVNKKTGKPEGVAKFSIVLLISKKNKGEIARIQKGIDAAKEVGKTSKWNGKIPSNLDMPMHDGDDKFNEDPEKYKAYEGMMYLSAKSTNKPKIIDLQGNEIIERDKFYSGCYCKASVNFFPYDNMSKGVACGLNNLLFVEDGENLGGGRSDAAEDFAADLSQDNDL